MDAVHPLSSPMVLRSLDLKKDEFRPCDEGEDCLGPNTPYLIAIGALMYFDSCSRLDFAFVVNYWLGVVLSPQNGKGKVSITYNAIPQRT